MEKFEKLKFGRFLHFMLEIHLCRVFMLSSSSCGKSSIEKVFPLGYIRLRRRRVSLRSRRKTIQFSLSLFLSRLGLLLKRQRYAYAHAHANAIPM